MAHYAFLDNNNIVSHVIPGVDEWETIEGLHPEEWYAQFVGQPCKRTSYNGNIRAHYAGIGYTYDPNNDVFYPPQPFPSWTLDGNWQWQPPTPYPDDDNTYVWNENTQTWVEVEQ
jgi:hypothetical protein